MTDVPSFVVNRARRALYDHGNREDALAEMLRIDPDEAAARLALEIALRELAHS